LVDKSGDLPLRKLLLDLQQFLEVAVPAKLGNDVAIVEAVKHIEAANHIFMVEFLEHADFLLQEGECYLRSYRLDFDDFDGHR
jgi:hypothetical protein